MQMHTKKEFAFSVVIAVYNVEKYLAEAIESVIHQTFGFERIQLVLVDDGSPDGCGAICDTYQRRYPENILVIHQENQGVAAARNAGVACATGKYLNFLDADDKFSRTTFRLINDFFERNHDKTDVVSIPMFFFEGRSGPHILNNKFRLGTRIIDLQEDHSAIQLSASSAFILRSAWIESAARFDTNLKHMEDAKALLSILCRKMTIGVVKEACYWYRRRVDAAPSASQSSTTSRFWWMDKTEHSSLAIVRNFQRQNQAIPKFIQFTLAYDLQWYFIGIPSYPRHLLSNEDIEVFERQLSEVLAAIDIDILLEQRQMNLGSMLRELSLKPGYDGFLFDPQKGMLCCREARFPIENLYTRLEFIKINKQSVVLEGLMNVPVAITAAFAPTVRLNGAPIPCQIVSSMKKETLLDEDIFHRLLFRAELPLSSAASSYDVTFGLDIDGEWFPRTNIHAGPFAPVCSGLAHSVFSKNGWMVRATPEMLKIQKESRIEMMKHRLLFGFELWKKNGHGYRKAAIVRPLCMLIKPFVHKPIWLVSDRVNKASDNGEAFFRYLLQIHTGKDIYFVIRKDCPDYKRMQAVGKVLSPTSWRYKIYYLLSECVISSQGDGSAINPMWGHDDGYKDITSEKPFVFLQHGVTLHNLSRWINRYSKNVTLFISVTRAEYDSILNNDYFYGPDVVKLTGFPRYDLLESMPEKKITIMPTWRAYLVSLVDPKTGTRTLIDRFEESKYFKTYSDLLTNKRFLDTAERLGYDVQMLCHPSMRGEAGYYRFDERVKLLPVESSYSQIFSTSSLVVTDYSSIAFDVAYLRKPVLYLHADEDEFFSGAHTLDKGYFDYQRDGFGEVLKDVECLVDEVINYMKNGCALKEEYRKRIENTFPFNDRNNSSRVYEQIVQMLAERNQD